MEEAWLEETEIFLQAENLYDLRNSKSKLEVVPSHSEWLPEAEEVEDE